MECEGNSNNKMIAAVDPQRINVDTMSFNADMIHSRIHQTSALDQFYMSYSTGEWCTECHDIISALIFLNDAVAVQRIHEVEDLQNTFNTKKGLFVLAPLGVVRLFRKVARSIPE